MVGLLDIPSLVLPTVHTVVVVAFDLRDSRHWVMMVARTLVVTTAVEDKLHLADVEAEDIGDLPSVMAHCNHLSQADTEAVLMVVVECSAGSLDFAGPNNQAAVDLDNLAAAVPGSLVAADLDKEAVLDG